VGYGATVKCNAGGIIKKITGSITSDKLKRKEGSELFSNKKEGLAESKSAKKKARGVEQPGVDGLVPEEGSTTGKRRKKNGLDDRPGRESSKSTKKLKREGF
jgi:hypothetical protein